jgi:hypothetical protein
MKRSFKALLTAMLIAVPMLASCSDVTGPVEPTTNIERQDGLLGDLLGGVIETAVDLVGGVVGLLGNILSGPDANGKVASAWIDSRGGTVKTAAYTLTVPKGAVSTKTQFVIEPSNTGTYMVELHAYQNGLFGKVEVGHRGFRKPVLFTVSYRNADGVENERKLGIIYIKSPKEVELQRTSVDSRDKDITAFLSHFSKYAMVQN